MLLICVCALSKRVVYFRIKALLKFYFVACFQVSAFSTWDKELPKFVFDPRYMLLGVKDRKVCFEDFIRTRAEEERKEKRNKLKEKKDAFKKLMEDARLTPK